MNLANLATIYSDILGVILGLSPPGVIATLQRTCKRLKHVSDKYMKCLDSYPPSRREVFRWIKDMDFGLAWSNVCWYDPHNNRLIYLNLQKSIKFAPTYNYITQYGVVDNKLEVVVAEQQLPCVNCDIVDYLDRTLPHGIILAPNIAATIVAGRRSSTMSLATIRLVIDRIKKNIPEIIRHAKYRRLASEWASYTTNNAEPPRMTAVVNTHSNTQPVDMHSVDSEDDEEGDDEGGDDEGVIMEVNISLKISKDDVHLHNTMDVVLWMRQHLRNNRPFRMGFYKKDVTINDRLVVVVNVDAVGTPTYHMYTLEIIGNGFIKQTSDIRGGELQEEDVPLTYRLSTLLSGKIPKHLDPITRLRILLQLGEEYNIQYKTKRSLMALLFPLGATLRFIPEYKKEDAFGKKKSSYGYDSCLAEIQLVSFLVHYWCGFGQYRHDGVVPKNNNELIRKNVANDFNNLVAFLTKKRAFPKETKPKRETTTNKDIPLRLRKYLRIGFPLEKRIRDGIRDEICRLCGCWVTTKSICSYRYILLIGEWKDTFPPYDTRIHTRRNEEDPEDPGQAHVPICDACAEKSDLGGLNQTLLILGHVFVVNVHVRAND